MSKQYLLKQISWIIGQKTTMKKEVTFFLKKYVASLFTISEKVRTICQFRF